MAKMYLGEIPISKIYGSGSSESVDSNAPTYINKRGTLYRLIFEDNFDKPDIDRNVWSSDYRSAHYAPWYVCGSDYFVEDSILNLRVRTDKRTLDSASWPAAVSGVQSCQVSSPDAKHDFRPFYGFVSQEGYYELRCKMYSGLETSLDGSHFAWWTTGVDTDNGKDCEYDMIEHFGMNPQLACLNIHPNSDSDITFTRGTHTADYDLGIDWHTWGFLWEEDHLEIFLDDVRIISLDGITPKYPVMQWLTAYRSLGERAGYWAGEYDPDQPDMISQIDYLRVYKKADEIKTEPVTVVSYDPISAELTKGEYTINQTSGRLTAVPLHCYVYWNDGSRTEHIVHYETFTHDQISILDNGGTFEMHGIAMGCGIPIVATVNVIN